MNKYFSENNSELTNLWFKSARNFVAVGPEMEYREEEVSAQKTKNTIACNEKMSMNLFVQLCRQNDQSNNFKVFSAFVSSKKGF